LTTMAVEDKEKAAAPIKALPKTTKIPKGKEIPGSIKL